MQELVDIWWSAVGDFTELVAGLPQEAWHAPTSLPGWDVAAVVAHVAHLEATVSGKPHDEVPGVAVGSPPHVTNLMGVFTEQGVLARTDRTRAELLAEIREVTSSRHAELRANPPVASDPAPSVFGMIGWTNATLLRNRPLDVWTHEQDIRRALDLPGGFASAAAHHVVGILQASTGFVLGKKAEAAPGESLRLEVAGYDPVTVEVGEDGRGRPAAVTSPTVTIRLSPEAYVAVAGGRRTAAEVAVEVEGDAGLGQRVLENLNVTP